MSLLISFRNINVKHKKLLSYISIVYFKNPGTYNFQFFSYFFHIFRLMMIFFVKLYINFIPQQILNKKHIMTLKI